MLHTARHAVAMETASNVFGYMQTFGKALFGQVVLKENDKF